jgi:hypothetical protein
VAEKQIALRLSVCQGERVYSDHHDDLFKLNLETRRWQPVAMRLPKGAESSANTSEGVAVWAGPSRASEL